MVSNMSTINTVYFDMDGVLVNLYGFLGETFLNLSSFEFDNVLNGFISKDEREAFIYPLILRGISQEAFIKAKPTDEFIIFYQLIRRLKAIGVNVEILSSGMSNPEHYDEIIRQKEIWLKAHNLDDIKANFVHGSKFKKDFARPDALLIDDFYRNISDWKSLNSPAILHHNIHQTKNELEKLGINFYDKPTS